MHKDSSLSAVELASEIDSALMAYSSSSVITELDFRNRLLAILSTAAMTPVFIDDAVVIARPATSTGPSRWLTAAPVRALA